MGKIVNEGTRRIVLVEDDEVYRRSMARVLEALGYEVLAVADAEEALGGLERFRASLVLTDYILPGMTGMMLARLLFQRSEKVPVILLSGLQKEEFDMAVKDGHIAAVLTKPVDLLKLEETVASLLTETQA